MSPQVSTGARRFVIVSVLFLLATQITIFVSASRRVVVTLALYGFVFNMIFGKGYALIPSYFNRTLTFTHAPTIHLPLSVLGIFGLIGTTQDIAHAQRVGAIMWCSGVVVFVGTIGWTIRDNILGGDTGTGDANADRETVDRISNLFIPIVLAYFIIGSVELLAFSVDVPTLITNTPAQVSHLLGAGAATLLLFAIGFRLFPRFLVSHPPIILVAIVLSAGAIGPIFITVGLQSQLLVVGLAIEATAVAGFAVTFVILFVRSSRRRVGLYAVFCGMCAGIIGITLAALLVLNGRTDAVVTAHYRTMLIGFLGFSIIGAAYQFYPPAVGTLPGATDRTALISIGLLAIGLFVQIGGLLGRMGAIIKAGEVSGLVGVIIYTYLIGAAFETQY